MSREAAISALQTIVTDAFAWAAPPSRRLKLWSDVPLDQRPACFLFEGGREARAWQQSAVPRRTIEVKLFIYTNAKDPNAIGAAALNNIMDALDTALAPPMGQSVNTLGGTAAWARIDGDIMKDPGDLDGDGMMIVPVKISLP